MHLYIHIPFCHEICPYCSFYKHKPGQVSQKMFLEAIIEELDWHLKRHGELPISTLYIGGGTPSLLSKRHLEFLFRELKSRLDIRKVQEITLEANPSTFDQSKANLFFSLGITRVSLGVQSFNDNELKTLGRDHSSEDAINSYHLLCNAKIPSINIDLMFSTPKQTLKTWISSLKTVIRLNPDHISCYNLTYEEDTEYFEKFKSGIYKDIEITNEKMFKVAHRELECAGYEHYETSNYCKPSCNSLHNEGYWNGSDYLGLGPSAVSCINRKREKNISDTSSYIGRIQKLKNAINESEELDDEAWRIERLALELRRKIGSSSKYAEKEKLDFLVSRGLLKTSDTIMKTTPKGSSLVDSIVEYLL